ncbi:MAG: hypothetical protein HYZ74_01135 [Elusimicrobia bacterium]|nr:hypothetical protein [Elusimicrobiota bacterium]
MAFPGTGISFHELFYRQFGSRYDPDLVVLHSYFLDRGWLIADKVTLKTSLPDENPRADVARMQRLVRAIPAYFFLCENSHLWARLRLALAESLDAKPAQAAAAAPPNPDGRSFDDLQRAFIVTFEALRQEVCARGRRLVVLKERRNLDPFPLIDEHVRGAASSRSCVSVAAIDFAPDDFYVHERHSNPRGHARVADVLFSLLKGRLIPDALQ